MEQFTVNPNKNYTYNTLEPKNVTKRCRSGYARVTNIRLNQPVPPMEWVEGSFHIAK